MQKYITAIKAASIASPIIAYVRSSDVLLVVVVEEQSLLFELSASVAKVVLKLTIK